jgi:chromosome segregation ATPase
MRLSSIVLAAVLVSLTFSAAAAQSKKEQAEKTKVHQELDELGAKIDAFAARTKSESEGTRERLEKRIGELRGNKKQADASLAKLEAAGESAGKDLRAAFQDAYKKLKVGYRDAMKDAPWASKPQPDKKKRP